MRAIAAAARRTYIGTMTPKPKTGSPPAGTAAPVPSGTPAPDAHDGGKAREIGGRKGPEPTRYGDWEKDGRCVDF